MRAARRGTDVVLACCVAYGGGLKLAGALRVTTIGATDSTVTLRVEGEVASLWGAVLESECLRSLETDKELVLDFSGVTRVDRSGARVVKKLRARKVRLINCWPLIEEQIRQYELYDQEEVTTADGAVGASSCAKAFAEDVALVQRLLTGDEAAFTDVVERYHGSLIRIAMAFVDSRDAAEEVVQETWLGVLNGLAAFEGRSTLKSWIFSILTNHAITRDVRDKWTMAFSDLSHPSPHGVPAVDPARFTATGAWSAPPERWDRNTPEQLLLRQEARTVMEKTIAELPPSQRAVVTLRDVEGLDAAEVCTVLELSETNQRVLLHQGRSKVRAALERYVAAA